MLIYTSPVTSPTYFFLICHPYCTDFKLKVYCYLARRQISLPVWCLQEYRVVTFDSPLIYRCLEIMEKVKLLTNCKWYDCINHIQRTPDWYWALSRVWWASRAVHFDSNCFEYSGCSVYITIMGDNTHIYTVVHICLVRIHLYTAANIQLITSINPAEYYLHIFACPPKADDPICPTEY